MAGSLEVGAGSGEVPAEGPVVDVASEVVAAPKSDEGATSDVATDVQTSKRSAQLSLAFYDNPILDLVVDAPESWFTEFDIPHGYMRRWQPRDEPLFERVEPLAAKFVGGSGANSARVFVRDAQACAAFLGSTGRDAGAATIRHLAAQAGLEPFLTPKDAPTGACAVLVDTAGERSMVTRLGASNQLHFDDAERALQDGASWFDRVRTCDVLYNTGFVLWPDNGVVMKAADIVLARHVEATSKAPCPKPLDLNTLKFQLPLTAFNVSAPFVPETLMALFEQASARAHVVMGNRSEWLLVARTRGLDPSLPLEELLPLLERTMPSSVRTRLFVATQGAAPTLLASGDSLLAVPVARVPPEEIVDTMGAGDAFAGAFIAALALGRTPPQAAESGHQCAGQVIRKPGFQL